MDKAGRGELFEGLFIWEEKSSDGAKSPDGDYKYRKLQGTWPVISLSFAKVKETTYSNTRKKIGQIITNLYNHYDFLLDGDILNDKEEEFYSKVTPDMEEYIATDSLNVLSGYLMRYYGKKEELSDTVQDALRQIEEKEYQAALTAKGIPEERIRKYGFAFCGKRVLIGK